MTDETKTLNEGPKGMYGLKVGAGVFEVSSQMSIRFHTALTLLVATLNAAPHGHSTDTTFRAQFIVDAFRMADEFIEYSGEK